MINSLHLTQTRGQINTAVTENKELEEAANDEDDRNKEMNER